MVDEAPRGGDTDAPPSLETWLDRHAEECGLSSEEFRSALVRALVTADEGPGVASEQRVASLEADIEAMIDDVRERVIQVKREADARAPADHDHADIRAAAEEAVAAAEDLEDDLDALRDRVETLESQVDSGFDNFEDVLDYLTEQTDDLDAKTRTLARAVIRVRDHLEETENDALDELRREANRAGVRTADCEDCGATVDVALLTDPLCPHCGVPFHGVEPKRGLFGSPTLLTGEHPPALESSGDGAAGEGEQIAADLELAPIATDGPGTVGRGGDGGDEQ